jgi:hypothetical protein
VAGTGYGGSCAHITRRYALDTMQQILCLNSLVLCLPEAWSMHLMLFASTAGSGPSPVLSFATPYIPADVVQCVLEQHQIHGGRSWLKGIVLQTLL